ncbi:MAG TPA: TlpA disulfide reductase family protein [Thermoanaerobaculaceae bacterium]|nr:TlpA disulfide reductase family protein [Thermoanaerobaculaceae bacterium]
MRWLPILAMTGAFAGVAGAATEPERPPFPSIQLSDLSGQPMELKSLLGHATVINFWATWCGPCRMELPELQKLYNQMGGKGLVLLAVDVDMVPSEEGGIAELLTLAKPRIDSVLGALGVTLPVYVVDGRTLAELSGLGLEQIPLTVLLDREGRVVRLYPGYSAAGVADLRKQVAGVLAEASGQGGK